MLLPLLLLAGAVLVAGEAGDDLPDFSKMRVKELRALLRERGVECEKPPTTTTHTPPPSPQPTAQPLMALALCQARGAARRATWWIESRRRTTYPSSPSRTRPLHPLTPPPARG